MTRATPPAKAASRPDSDSDAIFFFGSVMSFFGDLRAVAAENMIHRHRIVNDLASTAAQKTSISPFSSCSGNRAPVTPSLKMHLTVLFAAVAVASGAPGKGSRWLFFSPGGLTSKRIRPGTLLKQVQSKVFGTPMVVEEPEPQKTVVVDEATAREAAGLPSSAESRRAHTWSAAETITRMRAKVDHGLSKMEVVARRTRWGKNELVEGPRKSKWAMVMDQFDDRLVQILVLVAAGSAVLSVVEKDDPTAWVDPVVICLILVSNAAVGVWQEASADDSLAALKKLQPEQCCCKRDGEWDGDLPAANLVPGDVVYLRVGDKVPADVRLLQLKASTFATDEAALTGESSTVSKSVEACSDADAPIAARSCVAFAGTVVTAGHAVGIVVGTGMSTEIGRIQAGVAEAKLDKPKTPLAVKLDAFAQQLTAVIGAVCLGTFAASVPRFDAAIFKGSKLKAAMHYAKTSVALGVAAIPEGLPAVITLCLSLGTRRMANRRVIVRRLPSVETLGCTTVICSDKTGTLTTNQMTVASFLGPNAASRKWRRHQHLAERRVTGVGYDPSDGAILPRPDDETVLDIADDWACRDAAAVCALCNDARLQVEEDDHDGKPIFSRVGEPTEAALAVLCEKFGLPDFLQNDPLPVEDWRRATTAWTHRAYERVATLEFDRARKSMSVLARPRTASRDLRPPTLGQLPRRQASAVPKSSQEQRPADPNDPASYYAPTPPPPPPAPVETTTTGNPVMTEEEYYRAPSARLFVKGAPDSVLRRCTSVRDPETGVARPLTSEERAAWEAACSELAARPLRCLALATKDDLPEELIAYAHAGSDAPPPMCLRDPGQHEAVETGLTLVGVAGIRDPPRPEAADAIARCEKAGIRIILITGDSRETAVAISQELGILDMGARAAQRAFQGTAFFKDGSKDAAKARADALKPSAGNAVFYRTAPEDKQRIIKLLHDAHRDVTAMTGDGVNDAPALQQASIGVSMGTGTEVAKEASDMVLMDDDFASIVAAVEEGRTIYKNMQAFVCFLLSCNFGEVACVAGAALVGIPDVLSPLQLLWVNLVTDGPPATAIGFNPPDPEALNQPPRKVSDPVLTPWLLTRYALTGAYVGFATVKVFLDDYAKHGVTFERLSNWAACDPLVKPWKKFHPLVASTNIPFNDNCALAFADHSPLKANAQTMALSTLVIIELLKALGAVSLDHSLLRVPFWRNRYVSSFFLIIFFFLGTSASASPFPWPCISSSSTHPFDPSSALPLLPSPTGSRSSPTPFPSSSSMRPSRQPVASFMIIRPRTIARRNHLPPDHPQPSRL